MEDYYNIEPINGKYYIFNKLIMQFEKIPFDTQELAQEHINTMISMCDYMCN